MYEVQFQLALSYTLLIIKLSYTFLIIKPKVYLVRCGTCDWYLDGSISSLGKMYLYGDLSTSFEYPFHYNFD